MAGYSGTPLPRKLGVKSGHRVAVLNAPPDIDRLLAPMPDDVRLRFDARGRGPWDVVLLFTRSRAELGRRFVPIARRLAPAGGLWVCWPKKASGVETDVSDQVVRETGLAAGLVDNKVCAVDEIWSGLRFVIRLEDRQGGAR